MKHVIIIIGLFFTTLAFGQYKDDISIVQFSAKLVYNNGDVVFRIHGGLSLELPEDTIKQIQEQLNELQSNKF